MDRVKEFPLAHDNTKDSQQIRTPVAPSEPHLFHVRLPSCTPPVFMIAVALVWALDVLGIIMPVVYIEVCPVLVERDRVPECTDRVIGLDKRQVVWDYADRAHSVPVG